MPSQVLKALRASRLMALWAKWQVTLEVTSKTVFQNGNQVHRDGASLKLMLSPGPNTFADASLAAISGVTIKGQVASKPGHNKMLDAPCPSPASHGTASVRT